ncbi:hypothetical protein ACFL5V_05740 [Fibrobacterota bacterium]
MAANILTFTNVKRIPIEIKEERIDLNSSSDCAVNNLREAYKKQEKEAFTQTPADLNIKTI